MPSWTGEPGIAPGTWYEFEAEAAGLTWRLRSLPGVFSFDKIDEGSRLLLECLPVQTGGRVLDLGCGYGILGLTAARLGANWVDLVDGDLLAAACARENLNRHGITNASALASDVTAAVRDQQYSLVITNPPFHSGKEVDYEVARAFIAQARQVLNPDGKLLVVANRFIRYERLVRELFKSAERVAETSKYQVLSAIR
jgi:16S rRNA (guanine1207-N2)-methyltransferase